MSDVFRKSPSGPRVEASGGGDVESVFGRQGDVVAEPGDYFTSQVDNASSVPGSTLSDALDGLVGSDGRVNDSSVPGSTLSDALDWLDANLEPLPRGALRDTFSGGLVSAITAAIDTGNVGDLGWCVNQIVSGSGWSITRLPPEAGVVGAVRITGPTTAVAGNSGPYLVYGRLDNTQDDGPLTWGDVTEMRFRIRSDPTPTGATGSITSQWGVFGRDTGGQSVAVVFQRVFGNVAGASPNFQARSTVNPGATVTTDTGVAVDGAFHDFTIRRVDATTIEFEIDGVVVVTHSGGASIPSSAANVTFIASVTSPDAPNVVPRTFLDVDTFELDPAA